MNLAWSTAVILALLLPGFFFLKGIGLPERFSRDSTPRSPTAQLALAVLVSILTHSVLVLVLPRLYFPPPDFETALRLATGLAGTDSGVTSVANVLSHSVGWIAGYFLFASIIGGIGGWCFGYCALQADATRHAVFEHAWLHEVQPGVGDPIAYALTDAGASNCLFMYVGELSRFSVRQDGRFSFVVLKRAQRTTVALDPETKKLHPLDWHKLDDAGELLYIDGEAISNIFFKQRTPELLNKQEGYVSALLSLAQKEVSAGPE